MPGTRTSASFGFGATSARRPRSRRGFAEAQGDVVVTIDGDLQDDPAEIPRLLAKLEEGFDLVSGWKTKRRDPLTRRIPSRIFNVVTGRLSGLRLHDLNCGLKAYRADVVKGMPIYGELHRFIPVLAHYRGYRVAELPVNHRPREHGRSRYGMERYVRGFLDLLTVTFMGRYRHRPLHLFGGVGLLLGALGTIVLVYLTVLKLTGEAIGHRPLLTLGVLLVVVGVQLLSLGLVSELDRRAITRSEPAAAGRPSCTWTRSCADPDRSLLRDVRARLPAERAGDLLPPRRRGRGDRAARDGVGRRRHNWSLGIGAVAGIAPRRGTTPARQPAHPFRRHDRGLSRPLRRARGAKRIARGRPVIFNPLVSLHETLVEDRRRFAARSVHGSLPAPRRPERAPRAPTSSSPTRSRTRATSPSSARCRPKGWRSASSAPRSGSSGRGGSRRRASTCSSSAS